MNPSFVIPTSCEHIPAMDERNSKRPRNIEGGHEDGGVVGAGGGGSNGYPRFGGSSVSGGEGGHGKSLDECHLEIKPAMAYLFLKKPIEVEVRLLKDEVEVQPMTLGMNVSIISRDGKPFTSPPDLVELTPKGPALLDGTGSFQLVVREGFVPPGTHVRVQVEVLSSSGEKMKAYSELLMVCSSALIVVSQPKESWYKDEGGKNNYNEMTVMVRDKTSNQPKQGVPLDLHLLYESGVKVSSQGILQVQGDLPLITDEEGRATIKFKITEVSQRHQSQKFCVRILPDVKLNHRVSDIAPVVTCPTMVLSKRKKRPQKGQKQLLNGQMQQSPMMNTAHSNMHGQVIGRSQLLVISGGNGHHQLPAATLPLSQRERPQWPSIPNSSNAIQGLPPPPSIHHHQQQQPHQQQPHQQQLHQQQPHQQQPHQQQPHQQQPHQQQPHQQQPHQQQPHQQQQQQQPAISPLHQQQQQQQPAISPLHQQQQQRAPQAGGGVLLGSPFPILAMPSRLVEAPLRVPPGSTRSLHQVVKWTDAVLQLLQMELQWEIIGYERVLNGTEVDLNSPLKRCPVCRICRGRTNPNQEHANNCQLGGLLSEFKHTTMAHFAGAIKEQNDSSAADGVGMGRTGHGQRNGEDFRLTAGSGVAEDKGFGASGDARLGRESILSRGYGSGGSGFPGTSSIGMAFGMSTEGRDYSIDSDRRGGSLIATAPSSSGAPGQQQPGTIQRSSSSGASTLVKALVNCSSFGVGDSSGSFESPFGQVSSSSAQPGAGAPQPPGNIFRTHSVAPFIAINEKLTANEEKSHFIMLPKTAIDTGGTGAGWGGSGGGRNNGINEYPAAFSENTKLLGFYEEKWVCGKTRLLFLDAEISRDEEKALEAEFCAALAEGTAHENDSMGKDGSVGGPQVMETDMDSNRGDNANTNRHGTSRKPPLAASASADRKLTARPSTAGGLKNEAGPVEEVEDGNGGRRGQRTNAGNTAREVYQLKYFCNFQEMKTRALNKWRNSVNAGEVF